MASLTGCGSHDEGPKKMSGGAAPVPGDPAESASNKENTSPPPSQSGKSSGTDDSSGESRSSSGSGGHGPPSPSKMSTCRTSDLRISAKDQGEAREGVGSILITFANTGGDCRMSGFPGVDLKTNYGTQSVDRNKQEVGTAFTLTAGKTATASVVYPVNDTGGSGVHGTALVVTPPNETHSATAPVVVNLPVSNASEGTLEVTPVFEEH
ncbi:DUF4232 domain-containing protein [Streptomyces reniochalinae]|uniref:DUF4232 domain-containing protein n=1 Tax=Streptomyces reniochalinae TaxID=2250578 RepID=UPI0011C0407C|nr:DUF4232 domain-containing protein [Streptomyces reniochalinae]